MSITPRKTPTPTPASIAPGLSDAERDARATAFIAGAPDATKSKTKSKTVRVPGVDGRPGGIAGPDGKLSRSTVMVSMLPASLDQLDQLAALLGLSRSATIVMLVRDRAKSEGLISN